MSYCKAFIEKDNFTVFIRCEDPEVLIKVVKSIGTVNRRLHRVKFLKDRFGLSIGEAMATLEELDKA